MSRGHKSPCEGSEGGTGALVRRARGSWCEGRGTSCPLREFVGGPSKQRLSSRLCPPGSRYVLCGHPAAALLQDCREPRGQLRVYTELHPICFQTLRWGLLPRETLPDTTPGPQPTPARHLRGGPSWASAPHPLSLRVLPSVTPP